MHVLAAFLMLLPVLQAQPSCGSCLWYTRPAKEWVEALPLGNGRLGAMIFGGAERDRIQFNEHTVWTGRPHNYAHPGASRYLGEIRNLLFAGRQKEAEELAGREFMSIPLRQKEYQAFGDLILTTPGIDGRDVTGYRRQLDIDAATATVEFSHAGVHYKREVFASFPAQVIAVRLTADRPGSVSVEAALDSAYPNASITGLPGGDITMSGAVPDSAIRYQARLYARHNGGRQEIRDGRIVISGANDVTLYLAGATNFRTYKDVSAHPGQRNESTLSAVRNQTDDALRRAHVADHQNLFRRVSLDLGRSPAAQEPTDERIAAFRTGFDPELIALVFQYGRYLLIASSRSGGQPANLQGVWNDSNKPSWGSKYTVNINTEMNYWPAGVTALQDTLPPLIAALREVAASGAVTAKEHYNARGWVLHHNFDLWRGTAPINAANHGIWQTGGAWLAWALWDQYLFSGDSEYLKDVAYPLMRGAALFFVDALVKHPSRPWLITGPSNSPEQGGLVMGPTMDHQIVRALFGGVIAASSILGTDAELRSQLTDLRERIAPNQIGKHGQLQEWLEDVDDPNNHHRHVSHLWGVYPGAEITPEGTPDLFRAARQSLEYRGDEATGWSMGWKLNLWARFLDGDRAYGLLRNLIRPASAKQAGLYPNLFDAHPPFQIDGNFGATSGIAEMLLQSHDPHAGPAGLSPVEKGEAAVVHLLPALPSRLRQGSVTGLKARGGLTVDMEWREGKLVKARVKAARELPVTLLYEGQKVEWKTAAGRTYEFGGTLNRQRDAIKD
jgi:alpha-L-fucosidase 2